MNILTGPESVIYAVDRLDGGGIAALADIGVFVWEAGQQDAPRFLAAVNEGRVHSDLKASPDGAWIASHGHGHVWCWRRKSDGWDLAFHKPEWNVCAIAFPTPGVLDVVALEDRPGGGVDVTVLRRTLGGRNRKDEVVSKFPSPDGLKQAADLARFFYYCVDYNPIGNAFVFSPTDQYQHLYRTDKPQLLGSIRMRSICNGAALSPDGCKVAIDSGTSVYLHHVQTQEQIGICKVKHCYAPKLAWSPDGRLLLRADGSTTVRQIDTATCQEVAAIGLKRHRATAVRYSPDGLTYLVGTFKGPVVIWDTE